MEKTNIMAEILIFGDDFEPSYISDKLGIAPTDFYIKGENLKYANKQRDHTCWTWNTGYEISLDIEEQILQIVKIFSPKIDILDKLKSDLSLEYKVGVVINVENGESPAIFLSMRTLQFLNAIKSEFDCDLYVSSFIEETL